MHVVNMASLQIVVTCGMLLILSGVSTGVAIAFQEPICSKYHFEEQVLEKLIRIEHQVQLMDAKVQQFETRLEKGLGDVKLQQEALDSTKSSIIDKTEHVLSQVETNVSQTIGDVERKVEQTIGDVQRKVERMSADISDDRKNITDTLKTFMENTTAVTRQMIDDGISPTVAFFARGVHTNTPSSGSLIRFTVPTVNIGDGYDASTGYFTAPYDGTYWFTLQICTYLNRYINVQIIVAGSPVAGLRHNDNMNHGTCTSGNAMALLKTGDQAWVKCTAHDSSGNVIYTGSTSHTNSFSGVLLH